MAKFINLTPHPIVLDNGKTTKTVDPSGTVLRVPTKSTQKGLLDGFYLNANQYDWDNVAMPKQQDDTYYIVSSIVLSAIKTKYPNRQDFIVPDTMNARRDDNGRIVSVPGFIH